MKSINTMKKKMRFLEVWMALLLFCLYTSSPDNDVASTPVRHVDTWEQTFGADTNCPRHHATSRANGQTVRQPCSSRSQGTTFSTCQSDPDLLLSSRRWSATDRFESLINPSYQIRFRIMGCSFSQPGSIKSPPLSISVVYFDFFFLFGWLMLKAVTNCSFPLNWWFFLRKFV